MSAAAAAAAALLERLRRPSRRARRAATLLVTLAAVGFLLLAARAQHRDRFPKLHDEHMHLLQMQHLAHGRLWMPQHELADFFESFHIFVKPVYASVYFPGTALIHVPAVWLDLPYWLMPLVVAGACAGLLYRVTSELLDDGSAGLLAALMLVSVPWFRYLSTMVMSHTVMLLLALLLTWSWLRWRDERRIAWAAAIGACAGCAAVTRPVDALVYAIPIGVAMLFEFRALAWRSRLQTAACVIASALPFLALQLVQNIGITGNPLTTPYRLYADKFTPQMSFGFHRFNPAIRPQTDLPQRQQYYDRFTVRAANKHRIDRLWPEWRDERLARVAEATTPSRLLLLLIPFAVVGLYRRPQGLPLAAVPILYIAFYAMFAYLLKWYAVVIAPAIILLVLLGARGVAELLGGRAGRFAGAALVAMMVAASALNWPVLNRTVIDDPYPLPTMTFAYVDLPREVKQPAIVLFRFSAGEDHSGEPVYNTDVPWPDDAPIIRAHDLGDARNRALIDYYARTQPNRNIYRYDRAARTLTPLGTAGALGARAAEAPTP